LKEQLRKIHKQILCSPWKIAGSLGLYDSPLAPVQFVIEKADWAIRWVGEHVRDEIEAFRPGMVQTTLQPQRSLNRVVHFGSQYMWLSWGQAMSGNNRYVTSFFHGKPEDGDDVARHIDAFLDSVNRLDRVVTASGIVEQRLLEWGVPRNKLVRIPIGVDMRVFSPPSEEARANVRLKLNIPTHAVVIGSFQKDGLGWEEGIEPKMIKGPDLYIDALGKLKTAGVPVLAFLTGPAREYVKRGLDLVGVPFVHMYVRDHAELRTCYHALDLYFVTSREEGGPMGLMESMASGVPVVSTRVGMAPDLIVSGESGMLVNDYSGESIAAKALEILNAGPNELKELRARALTSVRVADWPTVGRNHWCDVYRELVDLRP
jgi:glycosyltransferase involved in cell wall biosynthesis